MLPSLLQHAAPVSLVDMSTDPNFCADAFIDPTIAVPEVVMFCIRYLQRVDHVPGVLLVGLQSAIATKIKASTRAVSRCLLW